MNDHRLPDPELPDQDAAELAAYLDGLLPNERAAAVAARIAGDPALAAAIDRRRGAMAIVSAAVCETQAPHALRLRLDALESKPPLRTRVRRHRLPFAGLAGAAAAVLLALLVQGSGLSVRETLVAAVRPPIAAAALDPIQPRLLRERVEDVRFPNFETKFGWRPAGVRDDELDGRPTRTVFYEKEGRRIAYTIVAGEALDQPDAERTVLEGVELRTLRAGERTAVTWRRQGNTCVLSGVGVDGATLRELASWKGTGAVRF